MKENAIGHLVKTNPIKANLSQLKPISNPIKANLKRAKMNVNLYVIEDYRKKMISQSKKTNPTCRGVASGEAGFKPNLKRAKMNVNSIITKDYRKNDTFLVRINKANFFKGPK